MTRETSSKTAAKARETVEAVTAASPAIPLKPRFR